MSCHDDTLGTIYRMLKKTFIAHDIDAAEQQARWIIEERTDYTVSDLITNPDGALSAVEYTHILNDMQARQNGMPLSRVYGVREFWGLDFKLVPETLDPRPDTELMIEIACQRLKDKSPEMILDLGTGSGCILISLLHEFTKSHGIGVDVSCAAALCAQKNAAHNKCDDRAQFVCGSWWDSLSSTFDLITCNPPYITMEIIQGLDVEVKKHDPMRALDGGADGLAPYRILFPHLKKYLKKGGIALFEIGYDQENSVMRLAEESGFTEISTHSDLSGNPRVVEISYGDK